MKDDAAYFSDVFIQLNKIERIPLFKECHGEGESVDPKLRCKKCNGKKVIRERKILEVRI